jgi:hypothetical protein
MAAKLMTGSKKLVQLLSRLGCIVNYNAIEELETNLAESILARQKGSPEGTVFGAIMGLAFDNYDELNCKFSGADTLHDTMGIMYQNISENGAVSISNDPCTHSPIKKTRKRKLELHQQQLQAYHKKSRIGTFDYTTTDLTQPPDKRNEVQIIDLLWMMLHAVGVPKTPMWVGFNAMHTTDCMPTQKILYMKNIGQPITRNDIIQETLLTTQKCAIECGQEYRCYSKQ